MERKTWLTKIGNIRALAIILVVLGHSIILYSYDWNLYETIWKVPFLNCLKRAIDLIQMPLFFSLSGYLFVFTHKKYEIWQLAKNKCRRLIVPYFGVGFLWMLPIRMGVGYSGYDKKGISDILIKYLTVNDVGHLWFLPTLFLVFLLSEIVLSIVEHIRALKKVSGIILFLVGGVLYLEGYHVAFGYSPLLSAFNYLMWFALGYNLNLYKMQIAKIYKIGFMKWGLLLANLFLMWYVLSESSARVIVFLLVRALLVINVYGMISEKTCASIQKIEKNSFGIYLFHSPLTYITFANIPNAFPAVVIFINFVIWGLVALELTELIRKTNLRILIGE